MFWLKLINSRLFLLAFLGIISLELSPSIQAAQGISPSRSRRLFEQGVEHYNSGRYYRALDIFRRLKNHPPEQSPQLTASILMCMKSYVRIGRLNEVKNTAREFLEKYSTSNYVPFIYEVLGEAYLNEGYYGAALEAYLDASRIAESLFLTTNQDKIMEIATGYIELEKLSALIATEIDKRSQAILSLAIAKKMIDKGNGDEATLILFKLEKMLLPERFFSLYDNLKDKAYENDLKSKTIGVILSSGEIDNKVSNSFIKGVHQATSEIQSKLGYSINIHVIEADDALTGIRASEILSRNSNVLAIIGPTDNSTAVAIAAAGKDKATPILFPTIDIDGIAELGESVYQMNSNLSLQGRYAARYAIEKLNSSTVAVLAPSDQLGRGLTDGFLSEADELGAEVIAVEWYSGIPIDISSQLIAIRDAALNLERQKPKKIKGEIILDSSDNTFELYSTDFFEDENIDIEEKAIDSTEIILSTIDAVYLPIHLGDINYVASQFSSYSLKTQIIGNSNWYDYDELNQEMIGPNLEGMIILTDFLYPQESPFPDKAWKLVANYENRQEILMTLGGYDLTMFLGQYFRSADSRAAIRLHLDSSSPSKGLSRNYSIASSHPRLDSSIHLLKYSKNNLDVVGEFIGDLLLTSPRENP